ncbi:glycosyltransferase [Sphingomicrobium sp. XHP0239]|uniref:glycosyltransferase n=1 Tax=Sphingomicrobium maritimum TaxID=3133972 RepID=UPI0031CCC512
MIIRDPDPAAPLRIAVVGHVRFPIAAPFAGGMEAHSHSLVRALMARGHDVALFAAGDGDPALPLVPIVDRHYEAEMPWARWHGTPRFAAMQKAIFARAWDEIERFAPDVVHNNSLSSDFIKSAAAHSIPTVTTLHVPPFRQLGDAIASSLTVPWLRYATVSEAQRRRWSPDAHPAFRAIPNGIDGWHWRPRGEKHAAAVWAGRITPTKGTGDAVRAARSAGVALNLFGPVENELFFDEHVAPFLSDTIRFHGPVGPDRLSEEVARASVALVTPCWDEPFGLVAAEALACGTPVAGYSRGAIPEVVGSCGVLVEEGDVEGLARAIPKAQAIDPVSCRERGLEFRHDVMIDTYERLYADAIAALSSSASSTRLELA